MNPLLNRIFRSREPGPPRLSNSKRVQSHCMQNASSDRPLSRDKESLVPKIVTRQIVEVSRIPEGYDERTMKQRIILPSIKPAEVSVMMDAVPQTPGDSRRTRQVSSLRKKYNQLQPLPSEELTQFEGGFFATQTDNKPIPVSEPVSPRLEQKLSTATPFNVIEASGLTQRLFGDE